MRDLTRPLTLATSESDKATRRRRNIVSSPESSDAEKDSRRKRRRRHVTLYDAVAGRFSTTSSLLDHHQRQSRKNLIRRDSVLHPEEILFRRVGAPTRYAEKDIYHAHERLPQHKGKGVLPDSDMLKAIHYYASHYYEQFGAENRKSGNADACSMDETALLAFGILLEETAGEILGQNGDLVFTEGELVHDHGTAGVRLPNRFEDVGDRISFLDDVQATLQTQPRFRDKSM